MIQKMPREKMMQYVRETGFALIEAGLYLDTHPCDEEAMDYYNKYEKHCGPITSNGVNTCDGWTWTEGPWPWEGGCN